MLLIGLKESYLKWYELNRWLSKKSLEITGNTNLYFSFEKDENINKNLIHFAIEDKTKKATIDLTVYENKNFYANNNVYIYKKVIFDPTTKLYSIIAKQLSNLKDVKISDPSLKSKKAVKGLLDLYIEDFLSHIN